MKDLEFDSYGFPKTSGIFETIKTIKGNPIALGRHMRRALASGLELGISIPSEDIVRSEILRTIQQNPQEVGRLRLCFGKEFLQFYNIARKHKMYLTNFFSINNRSFKSATS